MIHEKLYFAICNLNVVLSKTEYLVNDSVLIVRGYRLRRDCTVLFSRNLQ